MMNETHMMHPTSHYLIHWAVSAFCVLLTSKIVPGFRISGILSAFVAALFIGFANAILWPLLFWLTLPINILTLGLFTFVINAAVLKICAALLPGFEIRSWLSAFFGWLVLSLSSALLHYLFV